MEQTVGALIHNRFDFEVTDALTGELKQKATAYNIIIDAMWTELCNGRNFFQYINLGSGTGTLGKTRTGLFNQFCSLTATVLTQVYAYPVSYCKKSILLAASDYVGTTITEVGVAAANGPVLVTHAMLQDSEGNPITIVKTATDIVTIYATIFATVNPGTNLDLIGLPGNNALLKYLGSGGTTGYNTLNVSVGASDAPTSSELLGTNALSLGSTSLTVKTTKDIANKKIISSVGRMDVGVGNGHIKEITFGDIARMVLPNEACPPKVYTGVAIGTGDGVVKDFEIPSKNMQNNSLVVYKNSVAQVLNTDYTLEQLNRINFFMDTKGWKTVSTPYSNGIVANSLGWFHKVDAALMYGTCVDGYVATLDTITNADYGNQYCSVALSPVELLLAVPNGDNISFYTVINNKIVKSDVTIDTRAPSGYQMNMLAFSPDGQHLAVSVTNKPLRIYKKDGNVFKMLTTGIPTTGNCNGGSSYNFYSTIEYHGDILICGWHGIATTITSLKRDGDVYTLGTYTGNQPQNYTAKFELSADGAHLYGAYGNPSTTVYHFLIDASGNLVRQADITAPSSISSFMRLTGNLYLVAYAGKLGLATIEDTTITSIQSFTDPRGTSYMPRAYGCYPLAKLSDTVYASFYIYNQGGDTPYFTQPIEIAPRTTVVHEVTAPDVSAAMTADYTVDGIHKTTSYVIDFQISTQFGEGV